MSASARAAVLLAAALVPAAAIALPPPGPSGPDAGGPRAVPEIAVYAAASLRDALPALAPSCEREAGARLLFNFGGSNDLARQIEAANKADLFIAADEATMDRLERTGLVDAASRRPLLSNRLVVVAAADSPLRAAGAGDLAQPAIRRIAVATPGAVPAGTYARAWLEKAGVWAELSGRVVPTIDVRAALAMVASGAAEAGVVYRTDAWSTRRVRILCEAPLQDAPPISYPAAALRERPHLDAARRVLECLSGREAAAVFARFGFTLPPRPAAAGEGARGTP